MSDANDHDLELVATNYFRARAEGACQVEASEYAFKTYLDHHPEMTSVEAANIVATLIARAICTRRYIDRGRYGVDRS